MSNIINNNLNNKLNNLSKSPIFSRDLTDIEKIIKHEQARFDYLFKELNSENNNFYAGHLLKRAAQKWPEHVAVIGNEQQYTYAQLYQRALIISSILKNKNIKAGDRVVLIFENSVNFYVAYHAIWQMGAVVTPVNTMLHANQLDQIIQSAEPQALIYSNNLTDKIKACVSVKHISVVFSEHELFEQLNKLLSDFVSKTQSFTQTEDLEKDILATQEPNAVSVLLYTSGTTGKAKGVMLSSHAILTSVIQGATRFDVHADDRLLAVLPLFHSYTQNTCVWLTALLGLGAIVVLRIERKAILMGLSYKPTFVVGIPQLYGLFCLMKTAPFEKVRYFVCGGDALADKIRMYFELIYRRKLCNGYGLTETAPFISVDLDDVVKPADTVGRPFVGIECQIRDDQGNILPKGKVGTLWVKGDNLMLGYYNAPELTHEVLVDGWLDTGDLARIDTHEKIVLSGRKKDLIKSKGIKVYPTEVENVLMLHSAVTNAAVIGKKHGDEEIPVAYVASKLAGLPEEKTLITELEKLCRSHLATYEIPRTITVRLELPITATGKVDKKILRKELEN